MKYRIVIGVLLLTVISFVSANTLYAQNQGLNVTVSPTMLEVSSQPGKTIEGKFRLRNNAAQPLSLRIHVDKLHADETGQIIPANAQAEDTYLDWLAFEQTTFEAKPQEWMYIPYKLTVPADAAFGYYYAIRIAQTPLENNDASKTTVLGEVVIPLLLDVQKEGAKKEAKLSRFTAHLVNEYLPVTFTAVLENKGNIHIKPRGNIFIRGNGERDLGILEINSGMGSILPNNKRSFTASWTDGFLVREPVVEDGITKVNEQGKAMTQLKINWNKLTDFRIGKYTATLLMVYDNGEKDVPLEATTSFWVIPYTAIITTLIALVVLGLVIRFFLKRYVKSQIKKYKE